MNTFELTKTWVEVAAGGEITAQANGAELVVAATAPAASATGFVLADKETSWQTNLGTSKLWARLAGGYTYCKLTVWEQG